MKKSTLILVILAFAVSAFTARAGIACGGQITKTNSSYEIQYYITDHLGSTRVVVSSGGTVAGTNDYYPFGKLWESANTQAPTTRYLFSGKEKQITGGINYMDFGSRMYDDFLGRWFTQDPLAEDYYPISPYAYCANNPVIYRDYNGEFIHILIGAVVGGVVNWVSHGCKFNSEGLSYFGTGAAAGALTAAFPGAAPLIAGGLGSANSILQQGYANGWHNIKWGQVIFDGVMSGVTSYVGGQFSTYFGDTRLGNWVNSIESPLLRNFVGAEMVGVPFSAVTSGLFEYNRGGSFWHGVWEGTKSGFVSSGISAIGASVQYSFEHKVNIITGKDLKIKISSSATYNFERHAFSNGRNDDLNINQKKITKYTKRLIQEQTLSLHEGDNTFNVNINGVPKIIRVNVYNGTVRSYNLMPNNGINIRSATPIIYIPPVEW
jgi:RHS repeat-associated protein